MSASPSSFPFLPFASLFFLYISISPPDFVSSVSEHLFLFSFSNQIKDVCYFVHMGITQIKVGLANKKEHQQFYTWRFLYSPWWLPRKYKACGFLWLYKTFLKPENYPDIISSEHQDFKLEAWSLKDPGWGRKSAENSRNNKGKSKTCF